MSIVLFVVLGFVTGLLARAIFPRTPSLTLAAMTAVSLFGALVGGITSNVAFARSLTALHTVGMVGSVVGTLLAMALVSFKLTRSETQAEATGYLESRFTR